MVQGKARRRLKRFIYILLGVLLCLGVGGVGGIVGTLLYVRKAMAPDRAREYLKYAEWARTGDKEGLADALEESACDWVWVIIRHSRKSGAEGLSKSELEVLQKLKSYRDRYAVADSTDTTRNRDVVRTEVKEFLEDVPWAEEDLVRRAFQEKYKKGVPQQAPALDSVSWLGGTGEPPALSGKVVLVNFWGLRCAPCLDSLTHLQQLYERYRNQDFEIAAIHCQKPNEEKIRDYFSENGCEFPVGQGSAHLCKEYWVTVLPSYYLIDRSGQLVWGPEHRLPPECELEGLLRGK